MPQHQPSLRAQFITRRTYNRPLDERGFSFETWEQTVDRVIGHQRWLWERAQPTVLNQKQWEELGELKQLLLERKAIVSGRTLWLGGTEIAKRREASMFNCAFTNAETVHDLVDILWLLLQGAGVGFRPVVGVLNGFSKPMEVEVIRSTRTAKGGRETNLETWDAATRTWTISVGDSAEAWAKSIGKLIAGKRPADRLVLDFSEIRPAGERLKGYGWISSGDESIAAAYTNIAAILNRRAGELLSRLDILDVVNWLGTILSSRRSAQIALVEYDGPEWREFAAAKKDYWKTGNPQRRQSNNSLLFYRKPSHEELTEFFDIMLDSGGSEPGLINAQAARERAPWFKGVNPCAEILLGNKSFCNLVEVDLGKFNGDWPGLLKAVNLLARANYRQTCVNLDDGILQRTWHELNEFLRLCGVGLTGIMRWEGQHDPFAFSALEALAMAGAYEMADELGLPRPKNVTTVKPSGTLSKIMDTTEGVHKPLGKYIFNNVQLSRHDPLVEKMRGANYHVFDHPFDTDSVLVRMPVAYGDVEFDMEGGKEVNKETAISQLERYRLLMMSYVQHNCSITVSYSPEELPDMVDWILKHWDNYVGVSFLLRTDPSKTAEDLGFPYLPQEVVTQETYDAYVSGLLPVDLDGVSSLDDLQDVECASGVCPIR